MKRVFSAVIFLSLVVSMSAYAGLISGNHTTDGGKSVNLQGLEWMPLTHTAGLSRSQVGSSNGFTDRYGNEWKSGDWRYATRSETEILLGSLWGGVYSGFSSDNYDGAKWFFDFFGGIAFDTWINNERTDGKSWDFL